MCKRCVLGYVSLFEENPSHFYCNIILCICNALYVSIATHSHTNKQGAFHAHLKVKGLVEPSGGVNMVYCESVSVAVASFPVGVPSQ